MSKQIPKFKFQISKLKKPKIIFLIGPTASGKSEVAVKLAKRINAEIVSSDSMQLYKSMGILSSQPKIALRKKIRHHLIGIVAVNKNYNVSKYRKAAISKIKEILNKQKTPLFVGGTGLYFSILLDGLFPGCTEDKRIRCRLYKEAKDYGSLQLFRRLREVDPLSAEKIHPHDLRRIVRALEVFEKTMVPISVWQKQRRGLVDNYDIKVFGISRSKDDLRARIDQRLDYMFRQGLVKEVKRLLKLKISRTASQALGVKEVRGFLKGEYNLRQAKELLRGNTYKYVKKQLTWFKKDRRINWIDVNRKGKLADVVEEIIKKL